MRYSPPSRCFCSRRGGAGRGGAGRGGERSSLVGVLGKVCVLSDVCYSQHVLRSWFGAPALWDSGRGRGGLSLPIGSTCFLVPVLILCRPPPPPPPPPCTVSGASGRRALASAAEQEVLRCLSREDLLLQPGEEPLRRWKALRQFFSVLVSQPQTARRSVAILCVLCAR